MTVAANPSLHDNVTKNLWVGGLTHVQGENFLTFQT